MAIADQTTSVTVPPTLPLTADEREELRLAFARLARGRGVIVRTADLLASGVGSVAGIGFRRLKLSSELEERMRGLAQALLTRAYDLAVLGLRRPQTLAEQRRLTASVMASGALGGAAGLAGFIPDATMTTLAIFRAIASEALVQGEDPATEEGRNACMAVFLFEELSPTGSFSQPIGSNDHPIDRESALSYHAARLFLRGKPLALMMSEVAARYGLTLSQKFVAQSIPIVGAAAGATVNSAFLAHYRDVARAIFTIRRLHRRHGNLA